MPQAKKSDAPHFEKHVLSRKNTDGSVAIMKLDNDDYFFTLDGIAAEYWNLIDGKRSSEEIQGQLVKKHSPPAARFKSDVSKLLKALKKEKLIR